MLAGEALSARQLIQEYGGSGKAVRAAAMQLEADGYPISTTNVRLNPEGHPPQFEVRYQLAKPESPSAAIRRRLAAGEELDARDVSAEYGVSRGLLSAVRSQMRNGKVPAKTTKAKTKAKPKPTAEQAAARQAVEAQLRKGAQLEPKSTAAEWGIDLHEVLREFNRQGYVIKRTSRNTPEGWRSLFRLELPEQPLPPTTELPDEEPEPTATATKKGRKTPAWVVEQAADTQQPLSVKLPPLGTSVTVVLHSWDPDTGEYTIGLRNGLASWLVRVR